MSPREKWAATAPATTGFRSWVAPVVLPSEVFRASDVRVVAAAWWDVPAVVPNRVARPAALHPGFRPACRPQPQPRRAHQVRRDRPTGVSRAALHCPPARHSSVHSLPCTDRTTARRAQARCRQLRDTSSGRWRSPLSDTPHSLHQAPRQRRLAAWLHSHRRRWVFPPEARRRLMVGGPLCLMDHKR